MAAADTGNVVKSPLGFRSKEPLHVITKHMHLTGGKQVTGR